MRFWLCLLSLLCFPFLQFGSTVYGTITDHENKPLPFAMVFVNGTTHGTTSNQNGNYSLSISPGEYKLTFQFMGFQTQEHTLTISQENVELNLKLQPLHIQLKMVTVSSSMEEPANELIRRAQRKREFYLNQVNSFSCTVFIKGSAKVIKFPPKKIAGVSVGIGDLIDSASGIVYLSESESNYFFKQKNKVFEEMIAFKSSGTQSGITYNRASDLDFNFYKSTLKNQTLSDYGFISPLASDAFRFYRFKLLGTFFDKDELIYKIQVLPKRKGDPVFRGTIYLVQNSWRIHSTDLYLDKNTGIQWVDTMHIQQAYVHVKDSIWMPFKNTIEYNYSALGAKGKGTYIGVYSNYLLNEQVSDTVFLNEKIRFHPLANQRNNLFWEAKRIIPLTLDEQLNYRKSDSIFILQSSTEYQDSVEHHKNLFRFKDLVDGYTYQKKIKKLTLLFEPMYDHVSFNTVQGLVLTPTVSLTKGLQFAKNINLGATGGYGFSDTKYFGFGHITYNYNTKRLAHFSLSGGKDMLQFNSNAISPLVNTLYTLLLKENFMKLFEKYYVRMEHRTELFNGFLFFAASEYADRNPLRNTTSFSFFNSTKEFQSNDPLVPDNTQFAFFRNQSFHVEMALQYTPFQPFYFEGEQKLLQESKFPTFTVFYKRALPGVLNSDVDLDLLKAGAEGNIFWKRAGTLHYLLEAGKFVNRTEMSFMDWKYFNGNKTLYSNFSGKDFQLLDYYSNSSNNTYAELHLQQNFKGVLLNKIPLLKEAKVQEIVTANFLLSGNNPSYIELGIGFQKFFVRLDYMFGFSNGIYSDSSLRFGFLF